MATTIYFDESGYTGNDLLLDQQPFFSYASLVAERDEARASVEKIRSACKYQGDELSFGKLASFSAGRRAILDLFNAFEGRIAITAHHKKYALACKFFEYIFEPCLSENNNLLYEFGFHKFVAQVLYMAMAAQHRAAEEIAIDFDKLIRLRSPELLPTLFECQLDRTAVPIRLISEFARLNASTLREELSILESDAVGQWVLELSGTSLYSLLCHWAPHCDSIIAVCDESQPLQHSQYTFDSMIGRTDKLNVELQGVTHRFNFNLAAPIAFAKSHEEPGVQLADVLAGACNAALKSGRASKGFERKLYDSIAPLIIGQSVFPPPPEHAMSTGQYLAGMSLLEELIRRAREGIDLLANLPAFVSRIALHGAARLA
ncbi:DUF3800 domain-containing protein [Paraburkholderia tropica]|uniref:DUF3800 domain-containing protein n=1 Tax=Paraburkholderia tropica TaxID=92647 RepID=A0AAQ1GLE6_9BURK|nr:DUF3800 domain-containing protein [Paraburkholderia tropica]RQN40791.1 DUF3800 domain-containing protein [Paraburkholderia tropica]SEK09306.1 Protein of unknown function [Paraburkholderia tropica]